MGKGGGALNTWLKEFTALVFTQTIQAFIYAIVISIIMLGMNGVVDSTTDGISANDHNGAVGLMSVFALMSVFKVEEMARRIFGISDTKASPGGAMKSLAKTAIAASLGKRVLNNAGKIIGGAKAVNKAGQDRRKLAKRIDEDKADFGIKAKNSSDPALNTRTVSGGSSTSSGMRSSSGGTSTGAGDSVIPSNVAAISNSDKRKLREALRRYEDQLSEINKAKAEGWKSIASGMTESIGSVIGGASGAAFGAANGEFDSIVNGLMSGAGIGDTIGKGAVESVDKAINFVKRNYKHQAGMSNKQLRSKLDELTRTIESSGVSYNVDVVDDA